MKHSQILFVKSGKLDKNTKAQSISISDMLSDMERNIGLQLDLMDTKNDKNLGALKTFGNNEAKQRRHWSVRLFWSVIIIISFTCCFLMVHKSYDKWQSSPTIISFDEKMTSISKIPFPAVTICPEMRIGDVGFDIEEIDRKLWELEYEGNSKNISDVLTVEEQRVCEAISHVCPTPLALASLSQNFLNILDGREIFPILARSEKSQHNLYDCY